MRKKMSAYLAVLCAVAIGAVVATVTLQSAHAASAQSTRSVYLTMYGWPDNDPPGPAIAYPKSDGYPTVHNQDGGTGTYADPVSAAVAVGYLAPGARVYISAYKKYVVIEDECATCTGDWIDMWVGGQGVPASKVLAAEDKLTLDKTSVIVDPPSDLAVDTTPMLVLGGAVPAPSPSPTATASSPPAPPPAPVPGKAKVARIVVHGSTVAFMWKAVKGATRYRVQILSSSMKVEHHGPSSQTWTVSYLKPHVPRYFRVAAGNGNGWGAWSPPVKFTG